MHIPFVTIILICACLALASLSTSDALLYGNAFGVLGRNATFDYIVVGGGTGGLAIAARLAVNYSVAVIEAGSFYEIDNGNGSVIPGLCSVQGIGTSPVDTQPLIDWNFKTSPQAGAAHRRMHYARGKTLGGSSARNFMAFHRGTVGAYQKWADDVGDQSYTFESLQPYFKRSAYLTPPNYAKRNTQNVTVNYDPLAFDNSIGGPLQLTWANYVTPFTTWCEKGLTSIGVPPSPSGCSSGILSGSCWTISSIEPGKQHRSSSQVFLTQAMETTDIKVYTRTLAERIMFNGSDNIATGVMVSSLLAPERYYLTARKEVIVSAGAFLSPQLLMISGIGPKQILQSHNITVLKNLPGVGQNLWDQPQISIDFRVNMPTASLSLNSPAAAAAAAESYLFNQTGPLTAPSLLLAFERFPADVRSAVSNATLHVLDSSFPADWPDVEYIFKNDRNGDGSDYKIVDPVDGYNYASAGVVLLRPTSRGNVTIRSAKMSDPPVINPAWLTTSVDVDVAIAGFKRVRALWAQLAGFNVTIGPEYYPGASVATDKQILKNIREQVTTLWHAAATCKMGKEGDTMAVVDSKARVFGTEGLRVVDASAFPFLTPGHPQSGVYMLAEKIADDILKGH